MGNNKSTRAVETPPPKSFGTAAREFLRHVSLKPHSVLGTSLSAPTGAFVDAPPELLPDEHTVFVDPAGLHHIQDSGPAGAGGASGAIYAFLGMASNRAFPSSVVARVQRSCDAVLHTYGGEEAKRLQRHVIHVVGPDFRKERVTERMGMPSSSGAYSWETAREDLALAYSNVLREFAVVYAKEEAAGEGSMGAWALRLLPISSGIFGGELASTPARMAQLTVEALAGGFEALGETSRRRLGEHGRAVSMCVFDTRQLPAFEAAFKTAAQTEAEPIGEGGDEGAGDYLGEGEREGEGEGEGRISLRREKNDRRSRRPATQ